MPEKVETSQLSEPSDDQEEELIVLEFANGLVVDLSCYSKIRIIGIETQTPIFQIASKVYCGQWANLTGTELLLDTRTQPTSTTVRKSSVRRIILSEIELKPKPQVPISKLFDLGEIS